MKRLLFSLLFILLTSLSYADSQKNYHQEPLQGWQLHIHKDLNANKELKKQVLEILSMQLFRIKRVLNKEKLSFFQSVPIYIELDFGKGACYHPNKQWLKNNGYPEEKHKTIEISNAHHFINWTKSQPWMMLHELAHAYHHQVLKFNHQAIKALFEKATKSGHYEKVLHINGQKQKHYALNDPMEYFAEGTEAYFGRNDFFPFVKAELKQHDPELFKLLQKIWE